MLKHFSHIEHGQRVILLISKKCNFFGQTLVFLSRLCFFFIEYHELRFKGKHQSRSLFFNEVADWTSAILIKRHSFSGVFL